jgi:hypothetical protein
MNMDDYRLGEISAEMSALLEEQQRILTERSIASLSVEDLHKHAERNQRLRDLCNELMKASYLLIIRLFQQSTRCCAKTESAPLELAVCLSNRIIRSYLTYSNPTVLIGAQRPHDAKCSVRSMHPGSVDFLLARHRG